MKILIVAFHKYDENMYPHLKAFIDLLGEKADVEYFQFRERGYSFEGLKGFKLLKKGFKIFKMVIKDLGKISWLNKKRGFDKIIVVDHFAFACLSKILPLDKLVFWSHDIISYDKEYFKSPLVQKFLKTNKNCLEKGCGLIIQDEDRLNILEKTLDLKLNKENVFFMPTFLEDINTPAQKDIQNKIPVLMQCGGVGTYRHSDGLLAQYQKDENYSLYLHGFIFPEIISQIQEVEKMPTVSNIIINSEEIYKIVSKCDIGFVGYTDEDFNFKYIAMASGQNVEFLKMSKPVIAIGPNNLGEFLEENNAGVEIKSFDELAGAVSKISGNYEYYSKGAFDCFNKYFSHKLYIDELTGWLK